MEDKRFLSEIKKKIIFPQNKFSKCEEYFFNKYFLSVENTFFFTTKIFPKC